jgi:hypothetical protein
MRKEYLPRPSGVSGANNPRRVFSTSPLEIDLARSSDRFSCLQLQEPDLIFGGDHRCIDPRTGLAAFGPYGVTRPGETRQVRIGIVGTAESIDKALRLLKEMSQPIEQGANVDCVQNPSFPGLNSQAPFRVHLVTQSQWHRPLHKRDFHSLEKCGDFNTRHWLFQEVFGSEVRALSQLENPPHVVLCVVSWPMTRLLGKASAKDGANGTSKSEILVGGGKDVSRGLLRQFRGGLRAECMGSLPTEIIWDQEYSKNNELRDRATLAWNLSLALLHKSGLIPWRLANASQYSCFVGISFYRTSQTASSHTLKTFAHVVSEHGDGFIVDGDAFEWDTGKKGQKSPHLDKGQAKRLLSRVLAVFKEKIGSAPHKVTVHKSTPYSDAERRGFENSLQNVPQYGLITISRRGIFFVRPGRKPILRGTAIPFGENLGLVFTSGYVPFLRAYSGYRIPKPLEITENWGSLSFQQVAQDLVRLTKLDLSSPAFCTDLPITLAHCEEIREVLEALGQKEPSIDSRYYG